MAYDSDVTEMVEVHLFQTMGNVRCTITSQRYALLLRQYVIPALKARRCDETTVFYAGWCSAIYRPLRERAAPPPFW